MNANNYPTRYDIMNDLIFLQALPLDLLYIVTNYNPGVLFIYCKEDLLKLNWTHLLKLNFHQNYKYCSRANDDLMRIYIYNFLKRNRIMCGNSEFLIFDGDGSVMDFNLGEYDNKSCMQWLDKTRAIDRKIFEKDIFQIAYGSSHTMILLVDGTLLCRGDNYNGQLGFRDFLYRHSFVKVDTVGGKDILQIACGANHTLILLRNGTLWGCGSNVYGQLGFEHNEERNYLKEMNDVKNIALVSCGHSHSFIKLDNGTVMSCGLNASGQLGLGNNVTMRRFTKIENISQNITEIVCGNCNTFMLMNDGTLMSCGFGASGVLGHGNTHDQNTFGPIKNLPKNIVKILSGFDHAICLLGNGNVMTCGFNSTGELGHKDYNSRNNFEEIKDFSGRVENIGTGPFAKYSIIRLTNGIIFKYGKRLGP
ncbi:MAG: hypothetical protein Hyperionvirus3_109 [Hyperionvirus sp.]|uniref:RCC1-like domain-containing protein n=1 Tax=Hyperionvirus sp. TaxID=2487770 RepID=A0A3G5AAW1_9VIRU|nr:MAG: hypothetical protein Hyperionvirus3_109 [Hyperionvirus sp.]